jgi:hypothetical protein
MNEKLSNSVALLFILISIVVVVLDEIGVIGTPQDQKLTDYWLAVWNNRHEHPAELWIPLWLLLIIAIMVFIQFTKWRVQRTWWALQGQFLADAEQQQYEMHERAVRSLREARMLEMRERPRQRDTRGME